MKIAIWCLINTKTGKIITNWVSEIEGVGVFATGFPTKKELLKVIGEVELGEEIRKIEVEL